MNSEGSGSHSLSTYSTLWKSYWCHQGSWLLSGRTPISFRCKDPQLNTLFYCLLREVMHWEVFRASFSLCGQGRAAVFQRLLLRCGAGRYPATAAPLLSRTVEPPRQTGMLVSSVHSIICVQVGEMRCAAEYSSLLPCLLISYRGELNTYH